MTPQELEPIARSLREMGVKPLDLENGFFTCFGNYKHTTPTSPRDCKLYHNPDGTWRFHCQHTSCKEMIRIASFKLSSDVLGVVGALRAARNQKHREQTAGSATDTAEPSMPTTAPTEKVSGAPIVQASDAPQLLVEIVSTYAWPQDQIVTDGSATVGECVTEHYLQLFCLFEDDEIVWCGRDVRDSGSPKHACRFRPVREWLAEPQCPGIYTCPSTFNPGTYSRSAANVRSPKFLVVESDKLCADEMGAIFRWIDSALKLQLRAVVHTGGKSLHGWFDYPQAHVLTNLKKWLPRLGCDPAMFNPAQPCRLPGAKRDDQFQRLIFIR